jgi:Fe-S cluster assembly protein SufD
MSAQVGSLILHTNWEPESLTFTADASAGLLGPAWLAKRRSSAWERFSAGSMPTEDDELWKYSDVGRLDLDSFAPFAFDTSGGGATAELIAHARGVASLVGEWQALVVTVDGTFVCIEEGANGSVETGDGGPLIAHGASSEREEPEEVALSRDALDDLHSAFVADVVQVRISAKATLEHPVVIVHLVTPGPENQAALAPAFFPHLYVQLGTSAEASVVEVVTGVPDAAGVRGLVMPVTELEVGDNSRLSYASLQVLPQGWRQLGVQSARVGRDASLRTFNASLGASAGRVRSDAELVGQGGEAVLVSGYLGTGEQLHDLRTIQDHVAPHTRSELLCKGAVTDVARSAYVGLTRVRNGAHGADAFQTNRNLVLSEGAHADSVPTLDIQENDVRCSHASTVGPIDEDQLYYLESRGIDPPVAERLIVLGFFKDLAAASPIASVGEWFVSSVSERLASHVESAGRD